MSRRSLRATVERSWRSTAAVAALLLPAGFGALSVGCTRKSEDSGASASAAAASASAPLPVASLRWPLQKLLRYELKLGSRSVTTMPGPSFKIEVGANVNLIPLEAAGGRTAVLMRLTDVAVTFDKVTSDEGNALGVELSRPFWFALERGKVVDTRISDGLSAQAVSVLRTIVSSLQLSEPDEKSRTAQGWQAAEYDSTGQYQAHYAGAADASISKQKQRYVELLITGKADAQQRSNALPQVLGSQATYQVTGGLLERVTAKDELDSKLLGTDHVTVTNELSLTRQPGAPSVPDPALLKLTGDLIPLPPARAFGVSEARAAFDALRAQNANFKDVLVELEAIAKQPRARALVGSVNDQPPDPNTQSQAKAELKTSAEAFGKLASLLRLKPETVAQAQAAVLAGSPAASQLVDALSTAGTDTAQAALVSLVKTPKLSRDVRLAAATSLIRVSLAAPTTVEFLRGLTHDELLQEHAIYGLGTASRRLSENGDTARGDAIADELVQGLSAAKQSTERCRWLRGIANSASARALPTVEPLLADREQDVRQAALDALRLMQDPRVDPLLKQRLHDESAARVRETAVHVVAIRKPSDVLESALIETAKTDTDEPVRATAQRILERWLPQRPNLQAALDQIKAGAPKTKTAAAASSAH